MAVSRDLRIPETVQGVDVRSLPLVPEDAFVLTRVDGCASVEQIAHEAGMSVEHVERALKKLVTLGAVRYPGARRDPSSERQEALSTLETAMRRTLARKLGHSSAPPSIAPRTSTAGDLQAKRDLVDAHLKQMLRGRPPIVESRPASVSAGKPGPDNVKVDAPVIPKATGSYLASTVNLLRVAMTREPGNPDITSLLAELEQRIDDEAFVLTEQAEESERAGNFRDAAQGFVDAARCKNDAGLYARAAECLLQSELDLRTAGDYAREASRLAPERVEYRTLLARIYLAAGMRQSALAELGRAESLAPDDESIKQWIARIAKEER